MDSDLERLTIKESEVEAIGGVDANNIWFGIAYRPSLLQEGKKLISFVFTQFFIFCVIFALLTPFGIMMIRNSGFSGYDMKATAYFLSATGGIAVILMSGLNIYLWKTTQKFETFLSFLDEIQKYNEVVQSVDVIDKIEAAGNLGVGVSDREEVIEALHVTRQSLINSLRTERILRENKGLIDKRYELFANIENNLATLRGLAISDEASEYGRLLNQALKIGLSVDREIQRLQNRPFN